MSFTITTDVFCDICSDWVHGTVSWRVEKAKAWKTAKFKGWIKKDGKMICPLCTKKQAKPKSI